MIRRLASILVSALLTTAALAQNSPPNQKQAYETGWTSSMTFDGSANSQERVLDLDSSVGYNFDKHWGVDVGIPLSFVSSTASTATTAGSGASSSNSFNGLGNIRSDINFKANGEIANYASTLTASAPTGSTANGISTGRPDIGWNNHIEHSLDRLTPFIEAGFSNGLTDTRFYHRPYTTLGFVSQFTGGSTVDVGGNLSVGASLYDVLPSGQQKMFSKLEGRKSTSFAGKGQHGRAYEIASETTGDASLTRDNGGSAWVEFSPGQVFDFQIGYTHSVHYAMDTVAFSLGVNLEKLVRPANK